jgi:hypothetical protein
MRKSLNCEDCGLSQESQPSVGLRNGFPEPLCNDCLWRRAKPTPEESARAFVAERFPTKTRDPLDFLFDHWKSGPTCTLPVDSAERKLIPLVAGCDNYFPAAQAAIAAWSYISNQKHNPGEPLHWSQGKSADHDECVRRHGADAKETQDARAKLVELTARAWRAKAELQMFAQSLGAPVPPGAKAAE